MKLGATPLNGVPSDRVPLIVPAPVTVSVNVADDPSHIAWVPLSAAVGLSFTVTVAPPVIPAATAVQLASVKFVNV